MKCVDFGLSTMTSIWVTVCYSSVDEKFMEDMQDRTSITRCCQPYSLRTAESKKKRHKIGNLRVDRLKVFALKKKFLDKRLFLSTVTQNIFCNFSKVLSL